MWNWKATYFATPVSVSVGVCLLSPPIKSTDKLRQLEKGRQHIYILHSPTFLRSLITRQTEVVTGARQTHSTWTLQGFAGQWCRNTTLHTMLETWLASVTTMEEKSFWDWLRSFLQTLLWVGKKGILVTYIEVLSEQPNGGAALACHWATQKPATLVADLSYVTRVSEQFLSLPFSTVSL